MATEHGKNRDSEPLLPGGMRCVWMTAGLVAYKLCDRDYDCERCPFDAAMRGVELEATVSDVGAGRRGGPANWKFPDDRLYHPCHGWVREVARARVRCGLDVFAVRLLGQVTAVVLPALHAELQEGSAAYWVRDGAALIPLRAPVSGTVVRVNREAQQRPERVIGSPYDDGWLVEAWIHDSLAGQPRLRPAIEHRQGCAAALDRLQRQVTRWLRPHEAVGSTLADGGEPWPDLPRLLGPRRHRQLIRLFLD